MKIKLLVLICFLVLTGCGINRDSSGQQKDLLDENQIVQDFNEQGIQLEAISIKDSIFIQRLKLKKPKVYEFEKDKYYFYFFNNANKVKEAKKEFMKKTESMNIVSHNFYQIKNVLVIHQYPGEMRSEGDPVIEKIISKYK
ncbi:hypothetical protein ACQKP0_19970 [Heyndrickxia sp. NPDC080065]|uniref:hypothetical protein n=1 Tax=Heyndrickxia sp. NPDC080065 TaxID=3390568 RepID=UPI003D082DBD